MCVREKKNEAAQPEVVIIELKNGNNVTRRPIKADSAIMHWNRQVIALKAQSRTLQIFDLEQKKKESEPKSSVERLPTGVYTLPKILDEQVALLHCAHVNVHLTKMTSVQAEYMGLPVEGPFKSDMYRY